MRNVIVPIISLLLSHALLGLGHGLQNTLLGVRGSMASYPDWQMGLMMSAYFFGVTLGTRFSERVIIKIGYIRCFAAFASLASMVPLLHGIFLDPFVWSGLRFVYGICVASLFVVIESWLNAHAKQQNRGRLLAIYFIINFSSLAVGQSFLAFIPPEGFVLFALISILISVALLPLTLSNKIIEPKIVITKALSLKRLYVISPLSIIGCVMNAIAQGAFFGLAALAFSKLQFSPADVAKLIGATFIGGLLCQWPIGWLSDHWQRNKTIVLVLFVTIVLSVVLAMMLSAENLASQSPSLFLLLMVALFGGMSFTLYSLFVALANDYLEPQQIMKASSALIACNAFGSLLGPFFSAFFLHIYGGVGLFYFITIMYVLTFFFSVFRMMHGRKKQRDLHHSFVPIVSSSISVWEDEKKLSK
jgi:MFS family permease